MDHHALEATGRRWLTSVLRKDIGDHNQGGRPESGRTARPGERPGRWRLQTLQIVKQPRKFAVTTLGGAVSWEKFSRKGRPPRFATTPLMTTPLCPSPNLERTALSNRLAGSRSNIIRSTQAGRVGRGMSITKLLPVSIGDLSGNCCWYRLGDNNNCWYRLGNKLPTGEPPIGDQKPIPLVTLRFFV